MTALAVTHDQAFWDERQLAALKTIGLADVGKADLAVFLAYAQKTGLDPFTRQLYGIKRGGKFTIQASIDGFRVIADRACEARGWLRSEEPTVWYDHGGGEHETWLDSVPPAAAKYTVVIFQNGTAATFSAVARFDEYSAGGGMWTKMPALMIAKCAEALALRKAFPQDLSGIYSSEEMAQADVKPVKKPAATAAKPVIRTKEWTDEQREQALQAVADLPGAMTLEIAEEAWFANEDVLDVPMPDGVTLRQILLAEIAKLKEAS